MSLSSSLITALAQHCSIHSRVFRCKPQAFTGWKPDTARAHPIAAGGKASAACINHRHKKDPRPAREETSASGPASHMRN